MKSFDFPVLMEQRGYNACADSYVQFYESKTHVDVNGEVPLHRKPFILQMKLREIRNSNLQFNHLQMLMQIELLLQTLLLSHCSNQQLSQKL
jgi:hypothetical protein